MFLNLSRRWLGSKSPPRRKHPVPNVRLQVEQLEDRCVPTVNITEFSKGITPHAGPSSITAGPDGNLWFIEALGDQIARITPAGVVTEFSSGTYGAQDITTGPDGNLWFTEYAGDRIGRITTAGVVTEFGSGISRDSEPNGITTGPDGNLWFTESWGARIGRITTAGVVTEFSTGITVDSRPGGITAGPDGNLWFTEEVGKRIGRITTAGVVTEFSAGIAATTFDLGAITAGPDGNLWFTEYNSNRIGRITTAGIVTEFSTGISFGQGPYYYGPWPVVDPTSGPTGITAGPDGALWFTESWGYRIGRITTDGMVTEFSSGITRYNSLGGITAGSDGNLWFTETTYVGVDAWFGANVIGRVSGIKASSQAPVTHFDVTTSTTSPMSGAHLAVTVTALDASNAKAPYLGTVHFTSSDSQATLPADYTFTAGDNATYTFDVTLNTSGAQTVTVTDTGTTTVTGVLNADVADATATGTTTTTYLEPNVLTPNLVGQVDKSSLPLLNRNVDDDGKNFASRANADTNTYVHTILLDPLNRPLDAAGQTFLSQRPAAAATGDQIATAILSSPEYRKDLVAADHQTFLGSVPDSAATDWAILLLQGATDEQIDAGILSISKYFNRP
jgi:streptogramin lyase